jgi:hypothetical protein
MDVSLDIPSYMNRLTEASRIEKYLKDAGGWDEARAGCISVAKLPNGDLYRYDGDHRSHMKKIAVPSATSIKAVVVEVSSFEEISELFKAVNYSGRKNLLAEEIFIHNPDKNVVKQLTNVGVRIDIGTGEPDTVVGETSGPKTTIKNFIKGISLFGEQYLKEANEIICASSKKKVDEYPSELLTGMACVLKESDLTQSELQVFKKWLEETVAIRKNLKNVHSYAKNIGGSVANKAYYSVAKGLLEEFYHSLEGGSKFNRLKGKINQAKAQIEIKIGTEE